MLLFPNAKINLGLRITKKRDDGFHDIETCMYPIPLCDALEIHKSDTFSFKSTGLPISGNSENNLVVKAYELMKEAFDISPVKVHLHKVIPMGAGLGGGSADAAYMLKMLNIEFELGISPKELKNYAEVLGSDCAFFIDDIAAICTGKGEIIKPIDFTLSDLKLVLVKPNIHISTKEAYAGVKPKAIEKPIKDILFNPDNLVDELVNDFEDSIFPNHPELEKIKSELYKGGAFYASMSGSGSTMYGLFEELELANKVNFEGCEVSVIEL